MSELSIEAALTPGLNTSEERPPSEEDFKVHKNLSAKTLQNILDDNNIENHSLQALIVLCSEHSCPGLCWSSKVHQMKAEQLITTIERTYKKKISELLTDNYCVLFKRILSDLQPKLEKFIKYPSSVASLTWLAGHVTRDHSSHVVPLILPHVMHLTDCWLPYYKVFGCDIIKSIVINSPPGDLVFYGRADLISDTLLRMLSHTETQVVSACSDPLIAVTQIKHDKTHVKVPGAADLLMKELLTRIETCSEIDKKRVYSDMIEKTVTMLDVGVARWVSRLCHVITGQLEFSPPPSVMTTVITLTQLCPECVAREMVTLLPGLVKFVYHVSWHQTPDTDMLTLANVCIDHVTRCDQDQARTLCHNLATVTPVNDTFDKCVQNILLTVSSS